MSTTRRGIIIQLDEEYYILGTNYSYDLMRTRIAKTSGNVNETTIGYFPNVALALKKYIGLNMIEDNTKTTLEEFIDKYETLVERVEGIVYEGTEV